MLSLLEAVWQGRTIHLLDDKDQALTQLAHEIGDAALEDGDKLAEQILARERGHNCSIGLGVACPHAGVPGRGELVCAVGWSRLGIDYGACNGQPVHLVIMYRIPKDKRAAYLDEMAAIARALKVIGEKPVTNEKERTAFINALIAQTSGAASRPWASFRPGKKLPAKLKKA